MKQLWRADFCHIFWGSFVPYFVATELILGKNMNKKIQSGKGTQWPFFDDLQMSLIDVQIKIDIIWVIHLYLLSVQLFCQKKSVCIKPAKDSERKTGEQRRAYEPPSAENCPAAAGEAGTHSLGWGEGWGPALPQEAGEEGGETAEGAERVPGIQHRAQSQTGRHQWTQGKCVAPFFVPFCQCTSKYTLRNGILESGMAVCHCNTSTWKVEAGRPELQSLSWLYRELKANLGYGRPQITEGKKVGLVRWVQCVVSSCKWSDKCMHEIPGEFPSLWSLLCQ